MVAQGAALPRSYTTASLPARRVQLRCAVASMEAWGAQLWGDGLPPELSGTEWEAPRSVLAGSSWPRWAASCRCMLSDTLGVSPWGPLCHFPDV